MHILDPGMCKLCLAGKNGVPAVSSLDDMHNNRGAGGIGSETSSLVCTAIPMRGVTMHTYMLNSDVGDQSRTSSACNLTLPRTRT